MNECSHLRKKHLTKKSTVSWLISEPSHETIFSWNWRMIFSGWPWALDNPGGAGAIRFEALKKSAAIVQERWKRSDAILECQASLGFGQDQRCSVLNLLRWIWWARRVTQPEHLLQFVMQYLARDASSNHHILSQSSFRRGSSGSAWTGPRCLPSACVLLTCVSRMCLTFPE